LVVNGAALELPTSIVPPVLPVVMKVNAVPPLRLSASRHGSPPARLRQP
jgi:hypothetical protein